MDASSSGDVDEGWMHGDDTASTTSSTWKRRLTLIKLYTYHYYVTYEFCDRKRLSCGKMKSQVSMDVGVMIQVLRSGIIYTLFSRESREGIEH